MSMGIQNNDAYLYVDPSLQNDGIEWTPNDGATVDGSDYGEILSVSFNQDNQTLTVQTSSGTLAFSGVALDEAKETYGDGDYEATTNTLQSFNVVDLLKLLELAIDLSQSLSKADSQARQMEKLNFFNDAVAAAAKIMDGAALAFAIQCATGALSIGMGLLAAGMSAKSLGGLSDSVEGVGAAKLENGVATTETELRQTNLEIATKQEELDGVNTELESIPEEPENDEQAARKTELEEKQTELEGELTELRAKSTQLAEKRAQLTEKLESGIEDSNEQLTAAKEKTQKLEDAGADQDKIDAAKASEQRIQDRIDRLQGILDDQAKFSEPPNPNDITAEDKAAMQEEFDKTQNWDDSGMSWTQNSKAEVREALGELNTQLQQIQMKTGLWQSIVQATQGVAQVGSSGGDYAEKTAQADAAGTQATSEAEKSASDAAAEARSKNLDSVDKFIQMWMEIMTNRHQTHQSLYA